MDLLRIIRSIEELLYELTSWLVFYPRMMLFAVIRPLRSMEEAAAEARLGADAPAADTLSTPLMLVVTILVAHALELGTIGVQLPGRGLVEQIYASEQLLLLFRALLFSLFPLMGAVVHVARAGEPLTRVTLRAPFFALCSIAAPFALTVSVASLIGRSGEGPAADAVAAGLGMAAVAGYLAAQAQWFRHALSVGAVRAMGMSVGAFLRAAVYVLIAALIVVRI